uniref:RRP15-like protein n=1 Tax=Rhodosorus marinus TaxID=101924 RepID=A0A7S0BEW1_9RHOD|mmetsp:Transcript_13635/g.19654  ORF Transcript_13635/g.19654 Transcript_13635/m.19654 type:complete len:222 (+) Transcript_13635:217-882(+)
MDSTEVEHFGSALGKILSRAPAEKDGPDGIELPEGKHLKRRKLMRKREKQKVKDDVLRRSDRLKLAENARVIPDAATDIEKERRLRRIATKGAVALFNAVAKVQRDSERDEEKKEDKKNSRKVSKDDFMRMVKEGKDYETGEIDSDDGEADGRGEWVALTAEGESKASAKLKDWDRNDVDSEEEEMLQETIEGDLSLGSDDDSGVEHDNESASSEESDDSA